MNPICNAINYTRGRSPHLRNDKHARAAPIHTRWGAGWTGLTETRSETHQPPVTRVTGKPHSLQRVGEACVTE